MEAATKEEWRRMSRVLARESSRTRAFCLPRRALPLGRQRLENDRFFRREKRKSDDVNQGVSNWPVVYCGKRGPTRLGVGHVILEVLEVLAGSTVSF